MQQGKMTLLEIKTIGVLAHPLRPPTFPIAENIGQIVRARGLQAWVHTEWGADDVQAAVATADVVVAIGGDGAMLRAARVCAPYNVPVLGINMGQLGFLTEIANPDDCERGLAWMLDDQYWIEERMMLNAAIVRDERVILAGDALNDVVISGDNVGRMITLETFIDGDWTTAYDADALVIATATGSTAYALACGGPILPPELKNILIVPAAPHLSMSRPIVLSEGSEVVVEPSSRNRSAVLLNADGATLGEVAAGDRVRIRVGEHVTRFVRMRGRNYFYRSLLDRLEPRVRR
jgi:NAD+ kinase